MIYHHERNECVVYIWLFEYQTKTVFDISVCNEGVARVINKLIIMTPIISYVTMLFTE
jgi:hypothetical protein